MSSIPGSAGKTQARSPIAATVALAAALMSAGLPAEGLPGSDPNQPPSGKPSPTATAPLATPERDPKACADPADDLAPVMVLIPPGHFRMGTPDTEAGRSSDEGPRHWVTLRKPFALGRCEVTVGQFRRFVEETQYLTEAEKPGAQGCNVLNSDAKKWEPRKDRNWRQPGFAQADNQPVVCVAHADAVAYAAWLSRRTGAQYRLPTEAEWEFAARATATLDEYRGAARYWGEDADGKEQCAYANGADQSAKPLNFQWTLVDCTDGYAYTAPVASFRPTALGLYDMIGNAWEWTMDCWHDSYKNAPDDGSAWLEDHGGDCGRRVVRGGSWDVFPQNLRSGGRNRDTRDGAYVNVGFRLARAL